MRTDHLRQNSNVQYYPSGTNKHPTTIIFNIDNISPQITDKKCFQLLNIYTAVTVHQMFAVLQFARCTKTQIINPNHALT